MKNQSYLSIGLILLVTVSLPSCTDKDAADVSLKRDWKISFFIKETDLGSDLSYVAGYSLDAPSDIDKYNDRIKEVKINTITWETPAYSSFQSTSFSGKVDIGSASAAITDFKPGEGKSYSLDYSATDLDKIAEKLKNLETVKVDISGKFSGEELSQGAKSNFTVEITINATITAGVL